MSAKSKGPKPRAILRQEGRRLWSRIWSEVPEDWELDAREVSNLELACRLQDRLADLDKEIDQSGLIVTGSAGQPVVSRSLTEFRGLARDISHLLGSIALPSHQGEAETVHQIRSRQGALKREAGRRARQQHESEVRKRRDK